MKTMMKTLAMILAFTAFQTLTSPAAGAEKKKKDAISIFDGKTLNGWTKDTVGQAKYEVVEGVIVGSTVEGSPNSFLCSDKIYGDFELEFDVKVDTGLNSGVQIRSRAKTDADAAAEAQGGGKKNRNAEAGRVFGPQVEIESSPGQAGFVYGEATGLGWLSPEPDNKGEHNLMKNDDWNHFRVLARGPHIQTWINGEQVADLTHAEIYETHPEGFIGLQVHGIKVGTGPFQVRWKDLTIRELPAREKKKN